MKIYNYIKHILILMLSFTIPVQAQFDFWEPLSPIPADYIETMLIDNTGVIYTGTYFDDHFYISFDRGSSWVSSDINCSLFTEDITLDLNGNVYFADLGCIYRSSDNGMNWEHFKSTFQCRTVFINSLSYIFSCEEQDWNVGRLHRSTDDGISWEYYDFPNHEVVYSMVADSYGNLYAGTTGGIYISSDNGDSWGQNQLSGEWIPSLTITSNDIIVAGTWNHGIYRSTDFGANWEQTSITVSEVRDITLDKNGYLWTATSNGVFKSTNDGVHWLPLNSSGLSNNNIKAITIDPDGFIVVGIDSGKVFRTVETTTSVTEILQFKDFSISQNYPNPFNPSTKIKFTIPVTLSGDQGSLVTLKIYDVLGNEIATLVNEEKSVGNYEVEWNASDFPSGIYFYQLRAGDFVETKKMILLR